MNHVSSDHTPSNDVMQAKISLPLAALLTFLGGATVAGGVWFVLQSTVAAHATQLNELRPVPAKVEQMERDGIRRQVAIDRLETQADTVQQLLIRIDERTQQTAKDVVELKTRIAR